MSDPYENAIAKVSYHDSDFLWEDHRAAVEHLIHPFNCVPAAEAGSGAEHSASEAWDAFYTSHNDFFKPRRYLLAEFPHLTPTGVPLLILEVGCGSGSSALPILLANSHAAVIAVDISHVAVASVSAAAAAAGIGRERFCAFVADFTVADGAMTRGLAAAIASGWGGAAAAAAASAAAPAAAGEKGAEAGFFDLALCVFVLSAVRPERATAFAAAVVGAVKPGGGRVLVRDYGLFDLPQLRFPESQRMGERLWRRQDGTLARFFHIDELGALAAAAGAEEEEARWACVEVPNRAIGVSMRRVFVHGCWRRAAQTAEDRE